MARWSPEKIRSLRKMYEETQEGFAPRVGVVGSRVAAWEQGEGVPSRTAQLLLDRLEEDAREGKIREMAGA